MGELEFAAGVVKPLAAPYSQPSCWFGPDTEHGTCLGQHAQLAGSRILRPTRGCSEVNICWLAGCCHSHRPHTALHADVPAAGQCPPAPACRSAQCTRWTTRTSSNSMPGEHRGQCYWPLSRGVQAPSAANNRCHSLAAGWPHLLLRAEAPASTITPRLLRQRPAAVCQRGFSLGDTQVPVASASRLRWPLQEQQSTAHVGKQDLNAPEGVHSRISSYSVK